MEKGINIQFHDELNPDLWDGDTLKPDVIQTLILIAKEFVEFLKIEVVVDDIIMVGSSANYNYTKHSDIDLHIVVPFKKLDDNEEFVREFFMSKKFIWNTEHDIKIHGHEVELYVQDINEEVKSSAVYSIKNNSWIKKPSKVNPTIDRKSVYDKVHDFIERIELARENLPALRELKDKLKLMRQSGLEKAGEYSVENLTFKVLRNTGQIGKLVDYVKDIFDKQLSLAESQDWDSLLK